MMMYTKNQKAALVAKGRRDPQETGAEAGAHE